jgi:hypothetical protein
MAKKSLFNRPYEAYTPEARELSDEVWKVLEPIIDKYARRHPLRHIESVILASAAVLTSEKILKRAIARAEKEEAKEPQ